MTLESGLIQVWSFSVGRLPLCGSMVAGYAGRSCRFGRDGRWWRDGAFMARIVALGNAVAKHWCEEFRECDERTNRLARHLIVAGLVLLDPLIADPAQYVEASY